LLLGTPCDRGVVGGEQGPLNQFALIQVTPPMSIIVTSEHQSIGFRVEETIVRCTFNVAND